MEDRTYQKVAAIIIAAAILGVTVYGTYLPMRKAQMFIATLQSLQSSPATSLSNLESRISVPLDYPSPVGQEELVRNMANSVLAFVQQGADPSSTAELMNFLGGYYNPLLDRGKGMSFGQDLYLEGAINEIAFATTGNQSYLTAAKAWYEKAHQLGPNRPQALYGLFDIYRAANDKTDTIATAQKILANWPSDARIQTALQQFETTQTSTATSAAQK
jgi:tetratricopeptide (TPR) repeat protein